MTLPLPVGRAATVEVPATSANLGPGFDCFGLALDWYERVHLEVIEAGYSIDVSGEGADAIPRDESHLIIRSALVGLADLGFDAPGLALHCRNTIPHGRGLGSSSAAIVAGLAAAAALAERDGDERWLLAHANAIEGHPDNVSAAIHGGFVLAYEANGIQVARGDVSPDVRAAVFIPDARGDHGGGSALAARCGSPHRRRRELGESGPTGVRLGQRSGPAPGRDA